MKAFKYDYGLAGLDRGGIVVEPTDDLIRFQQELIDAVAPFTVETGSAAAFVTTPEAPEINQPTIDYVAAFVPDATGKKFDPHVTVGVAPRTISRRWLPNRLMRSRCRPRPRPSISSAISARLGRNSLHGG